MREGLSNLRLRLKALLFRRRLERDLEDEMAFHLEMGGEGPEASRRFGNRTLWKERTRELWTFPSLESAGQDLRYAWRVLRREPWLFAGAALVLALGVGANSAVLSLAHAVLLEPLPYEKPEEVVILRPQPPAKDGSWMPPGASTAGFIKAWRERSKGLLTDVAAVKLGEAGSDPFDLVLPDRAERLLTGIVTPNFFEILGVRPALGRLFSPDEPDGKAIVLSHGFWQQAFGGDPNVVGQSVVMTSGRADRKARSYTIVGVLPRAFRFRYPQEMQLWAVHTWDELAAAHPHSAEYHSAVARLEKGVTPDAAAASLADALDASRFGRYKPERPWRTDVQTIQEWMVGETRPAVLLLLAVSGLLLLVACVAVAGVLLVRLDVRRGELALRAALGAGRTRLTRQLLTEGVLLSVMGAAGGALLALATVPALRALVPAMVPRSDAIALDLRVLVFAATVAMTSVLAAALTPAIQAARTAVEDSLKVQGKGSGGRGGARLRSGLVAAQAGLATCMLIGASFLLLSFWRLHQVDLGFRGDQVVTAEMRLLEKRYYEPGVMAQFQDDLLDRVRATPGVLEAGMTSAVPFRGVDWTIRYDQNEGEYGHIANRREVDPGYFSVMGLELLLGRLFTPEDTAENEAVAVVSESSARDVFGRLDVLGERLALQPPVTIVGVVKDVHYRSVERAPEPAVYLPRAQRPSELICLVVRAAEGMDVGPALQEAVRAVDPTVPLMKLTTMESIVSDSVSDRRFYTVTTVAFSLLALLITTTGLAVVVTRSIAERRKELAVRAALGARPGQLAALAMRRGLTPALAGTALGLWAAWAAAGLLERFLFEASAHEVWVYMAAGALSLAIATLGSLLPTRGIGRWSPAAVLKAD